MKFAIILSALAATAFARQHRSMPTCANDCVLDAMAQLGQCEENDVKCFCQNFDELKELSLPCAIEKCGKEVAEGEVIPAAIAFCIAVIDSRSPPGTANHTDWWI